MSDYVADLSKKDKVNGYLTIFTFLGLYVLQIFIFSYAFTAKAEIAKTHTIILSLLSFVLTMNNHY